MATILVVDDTDHVRRLLRKLLEGSGYSVVDYPDAISALDYLQDQPVDLIISDLMMPEMDGYTFCKKVKADGQLKNIPLVFITAAFTDDIDRKLALRMGAEGFLTKPVDRDQMLDFVQQLLNRQSMSTQAPEVAPAVDVNDLYTEVLSRKLEQKVSELERERAALRDSEAQLRAFTDAIPELLAEFDSQYVYRYVNAAFGEWYGMSPQNIIGKTVAQVMGAEAFAELRPLSERALAGERVTVEVERSYPAGGKRTVWSRLIPKRGSNGQVVGVFVVVSDVTERVYNKIRLEKVNRALRTLTEVNERLIHATDELQLMQEICDLVVAQGGFRLVWIGMAEHDEEKSVVEVAHSGVESSYLYGLQVRWDDSEFGQGPTGMTIKTGRTHIVRNVETDPYYATWRNIATAHGFHSSASVPIRIQSRVIGTLNLYAEAVDAFDDEELRLLEELADDIGFGIDFLRARIQRDYAMKSLRESEQHLRSLVDTAPSIILWLSPDYKVHGLNHEGEGLLDVEEDAAFGLNFVEAYVAAEQRADFAGAVDRALSGEHVRGVVVKLTRTNEGGRVVVWNLNQLTDEQGEGIGVIAVGQDITEQRVAEKQTQALQVQLQQAQKMEAIGQLTGGIAHDFNNILASIIGYTELALERFVKPESGKLYDYLQEVHTAGTRARDLIAQMLAFSRSKHGEHISMNLVPLVKETMKLLRPTISTSIDLQFHHPEQVPNINADPIQMQQVLMNLCINSRDALGTYGKIEIGIAEQSVHNAVCSSCHQTFGGDYLALTVTDSGHGIEHDLLGKIFEPFLTTKEVGAGTGMGLAMVHGIVHNHHGHILVESEVGKGTRFNILYPLRLETPTSVEAVASESTERAHILVVDDEESVARFIEALLDTQGYRVTIHSSGEDALGFVRHYGADIDLMFTDQTMPGMSGTELAREVLKLRPAMPIILATGFSQQVDEAVAMEHGIRAFLKKPFDTRSLLDKVAELLKR